MLAYVPQMASGMFDGADAAFAGEAFNGMLENPVADRVDGRMVVIGFSV